VSVGLFAAAVFFLFDKTLLFRTFTIIIVLNVNVSLSFLIAPLAEHMFGYMTDGYVIVCSLFLVIVYAAIFAFSLRSDFLQRTISLFFDITSNSWFIYLIGIMVSRLALKVISVNGVVSVTPITAVSAAEAGYLFYYISVAVSFWAVIAPFFSLQQIYENMRYNTEVEISARLLQNERNYIETISSGYENMRRYRHDMKYSMSVIRGLALSKKTDAIIKYIGEIEEPDIPPRFCDNVAVNALVDDYQKRFSKIGADFDISVSLPEDISISSYELCTLLGNMLENAIEAVSKCERRVVSLRVQISGKMLIMRVINSFNGIVKRSGSQIVSEKKTGGGHGLKSIYFTAEKNGGNVSVTNNDKDFTVSIMIPL
jgi:signal transduction histidine kinase